MTMAAGKDLKTILTKLQYSDDAKVVQQITAQMKQVQARMAGIKQKLVVMSGKGGVGKSLVATNTAVAIAQSGRRVCLVDLDINSGDVAIMLQLSPHRNVNDLVSFGGGVDEGAIESLLTPHSKNLSIIAAPVHLDSPDQASAEDIGKLLDGLKAMFDFVVVD